VERLQDEALEGVREAMAKQVAAFKGTVSQKFLLLCLNVCADLSNWPRKFNNFPSRIMLKQLVSPEFLDITSYFPFILFYS
jgi:hypothetical protein